MNKKSRKITPSKLIELLSEELSDLPDKREGKISIIRWDSHITVQKR